MVIMELWHAGEAGGIPFGFSVDFVFGEGDVFDIC